MFTPTIEKSSKVINFLSPHVVRVLRALHNGPSLALEVSLLSTPLCKELKYIQIETKDERSLSRFLDDLQDADIINKLDQNTLSDPNKNYDTFIEIVVSAKAKHLPTRRVKFNRRKHRIQMWVTKGIIKSINTKDKMYKKLVQSRCDSDLYGTLKAHFNKYRNILKKTIAKAKRIYYVDVFNRFKNNIKQTWKVIKKNSAQKQL